MIKLVRKVYSMLPRNTKPIFKKIARSRFGAKLWGYVYRLDCALRRSQDPYLTDIIWVDPAAVKFKTQHEFHISDRNKILSGSWDNNVSPFNNIIFFRSFEQKLNGTEWQDTEYYQKALSKIKCGEEMWGCKTQAELNQRCQNLEKIFYDIKKNGYKLSSEKGFLNEDEVTVNIGRNGELLFNNGRHRLTFAKILKLQKIPVKVTIRHKKWVDFKKQILFYTKNKNGVVYAKMSHPDLADIPHQYGDTRFELINKNLKLRKGTVLDIGANWGHFCHKFEEQGFDCTAVENSAKDVDYMKKLRKAQNRKFRIVDRNIFDFCKEEQSFDVVLALAIFHHFVKTKEGYDQLKALLNQLQVVEIFFQPAKQEEKQMQTAYRNFTPEEFVNFIIKNTSLSNYAFLGKAEDGRPLYHIY